MTLDVAVIVLASSLAFLLGAWLHWRFRQWRRRQIAEIDRLQRLRDLIGPR